MRLGAHTIGEYACAQGAQLCFLVGVLVTYERLLFVPWLLVFIFERRTTTYMCVCMLCIRFFFKKTMTVSLCITSFNTNDCHYGDTNRRHGSSKKVNIDFIEHILGDTVTGLRSKDILVFCQQESHMSRQLVLSAKRFVGAVQSSKYGERGLVITSMI